MQINLTRVDQDNPVPENIRILFWDGIAFDIGFRHGDKIKIAEIESLNSLLDVRWVVAFKVLGK